MNTTNFEIERRREELSQYGRILSLRPSRVHKSKKDYQRKKFRLQDVEERY